MNKIPWPGWVRNEESSSAQLKFAKYLGTGDEGSRDIQSDQESRPLLSRSANGKINQLVVISLFYVALRLLLLVCLLFAQKLTREPSWLSPFLAWDGHWYVDVAKSWYGIMPQHLHTYFYSAGGFEPGWPLLIRAGVTVGLSYPFSAYVMSFLVGILSTYALWMLSLELVGEKYAIWSVACALLFPGSAVVFGLAYSEILSIGCAAAALLFLLKHRWVSAGLVAVVASFTSPIAVVLFIPCVIEAYFAIRKRREFRSIWAPLLAPVGFIGFVGYLAYQSKDLFYWWQLQRMAWGTQIEPFYLIHWYAAGRGSGWGMFPVALGGLAVILILARLAVKSPLAISLKAYCVAVALMVLVNSVLGPKPRFLYWMFPAVLAIPSEIPKKWLPPLLVVMAWTVPLLFIAYTTLGNTVAQP